MNSPGQRDSSRFAESGQPNRPQGRYGLIRPMSPTILDILNQWCFRRSGGKWGWNRSIFALQHKSVGKVTYAKRIAARGSSSVPGALEGARPPFLRNEARPRLLAGTAGLAPVVSKARLVNPRENDGGPGPIFSSPTCSDCFSPSSTPVPPSLHSNESQANSGSRNPERIT